MRRPHQRLIGPTLRAAVVAGVVIAVAGCQGGEAACAAPEADIPPTAQAGSTLEISVSNIFTTCNDQGEGPNAPGDGVRFELVAEGSAEPIAVALAEVSDTGEATAEILIPDGATGTLTVLYGDAQLGTVDVTG